MVIGLNQANKILNRIQRHTGGEVLISKRKVPYLRLDHITTACYFGKTKKVRVFECDKSYGEDGQKRTDFTNWKKVVCYLTKLTESKVRCNQCNEWKPISQIYKVLLGGGICTTCEEEKNEQND